MSANFKSFERELQEFLRQVCIQSNAIQAFVVSRFNTPYLVDIGIDEDAPPSMDGKALIIVHGAFPGISEGERNQKTDIILSVGHKNQTISTDANGSQQVGKLNNADFAELVGREVCKELQHNWKFKTICSLQINYLMGNYFPNFVHQLNIQMTYPKSYRESIFT